MEINLLLGREEEIEKYLQTLPDANLGQLKKGNIEGIKDFITKGLDEGLIEEHKLMKEIIKKEFRRRQNQRKQ